MALSVSYAGDMVWFERHCAYANGTQNPNSYYEYKATANCSYSSTLLSDNSYNITINSISGSLTGSDRGYTACGNLRYEGICKNNCCTPTTIYLATNLSGSMAAVGTYNIHTNGYLSGSFSKSVGQSFTLAPGQCRTFTIGKGTACSTRTRTVTFCNTNTVPQPTPPYVSAYASCSTTSYTSASFSASVSYGYCTSQRNSASYTITDNNGSVIRSGSGTSVSVGTLQANSRYCVNFSVSNGCYSASASACTVTATGNSLTDLQIKSWDSGSVRLVPVMGGNYYKNPTHQIQIKPCNGGSWQTVATSNATSPVTIEFSGLVEKTCYQIRAVTSNGSACTYTGNTLQFTTPEKGVCKVNFTSIEPDTNSRCTDTWADVCYHYETMLTPAKIWVYYRVKDGFDPTWLLADEREVTQDQGTVCFRINDLFPNQVVYEMYAKTHTEQVDWTGEKVEFTTPLCPEATSDNCESLTYMTEYLCASIKRILKGNKKLYANPYNQALCDPYNDDPTHLTLWTRYLRLAHAYLCILCGFMNLSSSHKGQYLVGEIGWVQMLTEIVESEVEQDGWKLADGNAIYEYIHKKLKEVWHYQGTVDIIVNSMSDLKEYLNAKTAIVIENNKIYEYQGGEWVESETQPEDFGVWHINQESDVAKAESGWYYWQGTWNNLDADLEQIEETLKDLEARSKYLILNAEGQDKSISVVDTGYNFADAPDQNVIYFVTEQQKLPAPVYYKVIFTDTGGEILREVEVLSGALVTTFTPTKNGAKFAGWLNNGEPFDDRLPILETTILVATWEVDQVTVSFDLNGGEGTTPEPITGNYGMTITLPTKDGFDYVGKTFYGWSYQGVIWSSSTPVWEDMTLEAVWEAIMLTVSIHYDDTIPDEVFQVEWGTYLNVPSPIEKPGWDFIGWKDKDGNDFDFSKPITENVTIYAEYLISNVTVSFNAQTLPPDSGESVENPETQVIQRGAFATEPVVAAQNYIIMYWTLNGERYNFDKPVLEDITLTAVWALAVEVEFDPDGGQPAPETQRVPEGGYATKPEPDPEKEGCEFLGWNAQPVVYYTVTIDSGVDGVYPYTVEVAEGKTLAQPNTPVNLDPDCVWVGWYKDGKEYDFAQPVTSNFTLQGTWDCNCKVTFHPNNGEDNFVQEVEKGGLAREPAPPSYPGCKFDGWSDIYVAPPGEGGEPSIDPAPAGYHNVVFYKRNGDSPLVVVVKDGERLPVILDPYRKGCRFLSWTDNPNIKTVTFFLQAGDKWKADYSIDVEENSTLPQPLDPHRYGCKFDYWEEK